MRQSSSLNLLNTGMPLDLAQDASLPRPVVSHISYKGTYPLKKKSCNIETYTLPYVKEIASGNLLYALGAQTQCPVSA